MMDILLILVYTMIFFMFSIWPAIHIVEFIDKRRELKPKLKNFLTLFSTILIAFSLSIFLKYA